MGAIGIGPTLALRQRRAVVGPQAPAFDFSGGPGSGAALSRSTPAARVTAAGLVAREAADAARMDHDPATLAARGLLLEAGATNLLLWSEAPEQGAWTKSAVVVSADAGVGPDGSGAADRVGENGATGQHRLFQGAGVVAGQAYAASVWVKAAGRSRGVLRLTGAGSVANMAFDLVAGTAAATAGTAAIAPYPDGWFRVSAAGVADGASLTWLLLLADAGGAVSYQGDGASGLLVWGAQLEAGAAATSYVASAAAAGTRGADALTLDWGAKGVPDGAATVRWRFDDGSTQESGITVAGGLAGAPVPLARPWLRGAQLI